MNEGGAIRRVTGWALRRPRLTLAVWLLVTVALAVNGTRLEGHIAPTSIEVPGTASQRAQDLADREIGSRGQAPILLQGPQGAVEAQARGLAAALRGDRRNTVLTSLDPGAPPQLRPAGGGAVLLVERPTDESFGPEVGDAVRRVVRAEVHPPVRASVSGFSVIGGAISERSVSDAHSAEIIAVPILLVVLLLVFRSPLAAGIPALLGGATVASALGVADIVAQLRDVTDVATPLASMMGLALGVDYSLLMVSRFREARRRGRDVDAAAALAARTSGRTVVIAGATILATMAVAVVLAPGTFLQSAAIGAAAAALVAMAAALTAVPATLVLIGRHLDRWRIGPAARSDEAGWGRLAGLVLRRPALAALPAIAVLGALAVPGVGLDVGPPDVRVLPAGAPARTATERVVRALGQGWTAPLQAYAVDRSGRLRTPAGQTALSRLRAALIADRDAALVLGPRIVRRTAVLTVVPRSGPNDPATARLYDRTRARMRTFAAATGSRTAVGGVAAQLTDYRRAFQARLPVLVLALSAVALIALVLVLRALLLPLIAVLLNAAVVAASFGVLALLSTGKSPLLGGAGFADALSLLALVALVFGLSLDYQVFILTRLREGWDSSGRVDVAVRSAIVRTGPVVMGAAAIMSGVFLAFMTAPLQTIRQTGTGLVATVLLAASAVCLLAIPAALRIAGPAAFWLPDWLDRILPRIDLEGDQDDAAGAPAARPAHPSATPGRPPVMTSPPELALGLHLDGQVLRGALTIEGPLVGDGGVARTAVLACATDELIGAFAALPGTRAFTRTVITHHTAPARAERTLQLAAWCESDDGVRLSVRATVHDGALPVAETHATLFRVAVPASRIGAAG
ncbi:MMPL family transporter [Paraconexibacter antarcticus]|uniref:MMPL family transporter n=1 Tax=Paraconexibacter antarcticus TaxID=2949664 RepID=A0ABY5DTB3_9ACTN|nr:MMPL family transporter [Paraconexibacter antarcticus]UTI63789.1 MMPL family transporter [Paraconexibacter antarcticus]